MSLKTCTSCRFYREGFSERDDTCTHERAQYGGVREIRLYSCHSMRCGICGVEASLHEADLQEAA